MSAYDEATFLEYQRAGHSAAQIAAHFGVTKRTVERWRAQTGTAAAKTIIRPASDRERACRMLDEGCSYLEVAQTLGINDHTVKRWYPGRGWTQSQAGAWAALMRRQTVL